MAGDLGSCKRPLQNIIDCCMAGMSSLTETATETVCSHAVNLSPAMLTSVGYAEGHTQAQSNSHADDITVHAQTKG